MYDFHYRRPADLSAALAAYDQAEDGVYIAGGQTLLPVMKQRLASPTDLIDLAGVGDLQGVSSTPEHISIGAMTTHAQVAASHEVQRSIPALAALAGGIGDPHVRNRGTLGGSVANNDPAADYPAAVLGLGANVHTDRRRIAADQFFIDLFETALEDGELITRIDFPLPAAASYCKFENPASRYAIVGAFVVRNPQEVRVAITGAGPGVFRMPELEAALQQAFAPQTVAGLSVPASACSDDLHASADYRAHLIGVMAARAVAAICAQEQP